MTDRQIPAARVFTGRHMLLVTVAGFAVIIAVNLTMVLFATGTFPGMVVENSYVSSQGYNELIEAGRKQAGWQAKWSARAGVLQLKLIAPDGALPTGLDVSALAGRPSTTSFDRTIAFTEGRDAYFAGAALPAGVWEVDVEARRDGALIFRQTQEFTIPAGGF